MDEMKADLLPFEREERFIVVKRKHISAIQETALRAHMARLSIGTAECVVVESDWPEYETVWQMIEARCTGKPDRITTLEARLAAVEAENGRLREALKTIAYMRPAGDCRNRFVMAMERTAIDALAILQEQSNNERY